MSNFFDTVRNFPNIVDEANGDPFNRAHEAATHAHHMSYLTHTRNNKALHKDAARSHVKAANAYTKLSNQGAHFLDWAKGKEFYSMVAQHHHNLAKYHEELSK